jgi:hypothetical protein
MLYLAFTLLSLATLEPSLRLTHVRPMAPSVRELIVRGIARSPSLRILVERLERSDVIVYVYDDRSRPSTLDGRLSFMSAAGGFRYVRVRIVIRRDERRNIATLAHELQHAVEIVEQPAIVDERTFAQVYAQIGHATAPSPGARHGFDTVAAVRTGDRVAREVWAIERRER